MRYILILFIFITLSSCGTYQIQTTKRPNIESVLAVTSEGDTIQVSTDYLLREFRDNSPQYNNWRFYWDNSWYWGNGWFNNYDPYWNWRISRYRPYRINPIIRVPQRTTPTLPLRYRNRTNTPNRVESNVRGRRGNTSNVQPNRGRSNQRIGNPNYNRPTKTQTTRNVQSRQTQTRTNVGRGNNGRPIKQ